MCSQPDVRYLFKEWPIFGGRWEASLQAAQQGLTVWQKKGPQAYVTYHNAIYATGHNEGKLTAEDILAAASKAGLAASVPGDHSASLEKTVTWQRNWDSPERRGSSSCPLAGRLPTPSRFSRKLLTLKDSRQQSGKPLGDNIPPSACRPERGKFGYRKLLYIKAVFLSFRL